MWLVLALCILIALTVGILSVPVGLGVRVDVHGRPVFDFRIEWLFGRVRKSFRSGVAPDETTRAGAEPAEAKPEVGAKLRKKRSAPGRKQVTYIVRTIRTPGLPESLTRLLRRLFRRVKVRSWFADFRVGLGDPCDTALLVGTASKVAMAVPARDRLRLSPAFEDQPLCEGQAGLDARVSPITLLPPVIAFLLSPPTIRVLLTLIRWKLARK